MLFLRLCATVVVVVAKTIALMGCSPTPTTPATPTNGQTVHAQDQEESEPIRILGFTLNAPAKGDFWQNEHPWCDSLTAFNFKGMVAVVHCATRDKDSWERRLEHRYGKPTSELEGDLIGWCNSGVIIDLLIGARGHTIIWFSQEAFPLDCSLATQSTKSYRGAQIDRLGALIDIQKNVEKMIVDSINKDEEEEDF